MLFSLVKKDFLIVKKYAGIMLIISFLIPPFMLWRVPEAAGAIGFTFMVIFSIFMLTQYVTLTEYQFPKAATLLCAAPYPRKLVVLSKYCFCLTIYAACCLIFGIDTLLFREIGTLNVKIAVITFFAVIVLLSFYFPALYKLGYEKTKFIFVVIIMVTPVLSATLYKPENAMKFDILDKSSTAAAMVFCIAGSLAVFTVSAVLSIHFFERSDLT